MPPLSSSTNLADFPQSWGSRVVAIVDHKGPASYTQITPGNPIVGGDTLTAAECGMKFISFATASMSDDGTYDASISPGVAAQGEVTKMPIIWLTANTGAQVSGATNLSGRTIRCFVIGR